MENYGEYYEDESESQTFRSLNEALSYYQSQAPNEGISDETLSDCFSKVEEPHLKKREYMLRHDSHQDSPLTIGDPIDFLIDPNNIKCNRHKGLKDFLHKKRINISDIYTTSDKLLLETIWLIKDIDKRTLKSKARLEKSFKVASLMTIESVRHWYQKKLNVGLPDINDVDDELIKTFRMSELATTLKNRYTKTYFPQKQEVEVVRDRIWIFDKYVIMHLRESKYIVAQVGLLTSVLDMFQSHFSLELFIHCQDQTMPMEVSRMFFYRTWKDSMFRLLNTHGEKAYKIFKSLESLIIGKILESSDQDLNNPLGKSCLDSCLEVSDSFRTSGIMKVINMLKDFDSGRSLLLNFAGLSKLWGVPYVECEKRIDELKERTREQKDIDQTEIRHGQAMFRKILCRTYFHKHGKWPIINMEGVRKSAINKRIRRAYDSNEWVNEQALPFLTTDDWLSFDFSKTFEFNYYEDIEQLLSDKAINPTLENWAQGYCACAFARSGQPRPEFKSETTRLLMNIIQAENEIDPEFIIKQVSDRSYHIYYNTIKLKYKELEFKGRLFSVQTLFQRIYQTVTEHNIGNHIMKYLPFQSMTLSETSTDSRVISMSALQKEYSSHEKLIFINLDLEKWNMTFRHETCSPIATDIDDLFGQENVSAAHHKMFENCIFTYESTTAPRYDPKNPSVPLEGHGCHHGQPGGCEGLRQKLWTIITASQIFSLAERLGVQISLICQGDNQGILMKVSEHDLGLVDELLTGLKEGLIKIGLKLKTEETWSSKHLVAYSKNYYYDGACIDTSWKSALKVVGDLNSDYPCIVNEMGTISTGGETTSKFSNEPITAYFSTMVISALRLLETFPSVEIAEASALLFCPTDFGGLPVSRFSHYAMRGCADPIADFMSLAIVLRENKLLWSKLSRLLNLNRPESIDLGRIVKDPLSLNLKTRMTTTVCLEMLMGSLVRRIVKNPRYKKYYDLITTQGRKAFLDFLVDGTKLFPKILHSIYSVSPPGVLDKVEGRFDNTGTLVKEISTRFSYSEVRDLMNNVDQRWLASLSDRLNSGPRRPTQVLTLIETEKCGTQLAQKLRDYTWGTKVYNVTMPCPSEQVVIMDYVNVPASEQDRTICFLLDEVARTSPQECKKKLGAFIPFIGSETREKIVATKSNVGKISTDPSFRNLRKVFKWLFDTLGGNARDALKTLARMRVPEEQMDLVEKLMCVDDISIFSGCASHRMNTQAFRSGAYLNQRCTAASHIQFSPTAATSIARGAENQNIFFQALYAYATTYCTLLFEVTRTNPPCLGMVLRCKTCTTYIGDETFDFKRQLDPKIFGSALFEIKDQEIKIERAYTFQPISGLDSVDYVEAITYAIAVQARDELDLYSRSNYAQTHLTATINNVKPENSYNITELAACDPVKLIHYISSLTSNSTSTINSLSVVIGDRSEMLLAGSRYLPLLGLSKSLMSTSHVHTIIKEFNIRSLSYRTAYHAPAVAGIVYRALIRASLSSHQIHPKIIHTLDTTSNTRKRIISILQRHNQLDLYPRHHLGTPSIDHIFATVYPFLQDNGYLIVNSADELRLYWRQNPTKYIPNIGKVKPTRNKQNRSFSIATTFTPGYIPVEDDNWVFRTKNRSKMRWPEHHFWRGIGGITTGCSKLFEVLKLMSGHPSTSHGTNGVALCTADGAGLFASLITHMYGYRIIFNTKLGSSDYPERNPDQFCPAAFVGDRCDIKNNLISPLKMSLGETDITRREFLNLVSSVCADNNILIDIHTCDAEIASDEIDLRSIIDNVNRLKLCGRFSAGALSVVKVFLKDPLMTLSVLCQYCKSFTFCKPYSSLMSNSEVYVVIEIENLCYDITRCVDQSVVSAYTRYMNRVNRFTVDEGNIEAYWDSIKDFTLHTPCLSILDAELGHMGLDRESVVRQGGSAMNTLDLTPLIISTLSGLILSPYEVAKRTADPGPAQMFGFKRERMMSSMMSEWYKVDFLSSSSRTCPPARLVDSVNDHFVAYTLIYNHTYREVRLSRTGSLRDNEVILEKEARTLPEILKDKTKSLFHLHNFFRNVATIAMDNGLTISNNFLQTITNQTKKTPESMIIQYSRLSTELQRSMYSIRECLENIITE